MNANLVLEIMKKSEDVLDSIIDRMPEGTPLNFATWDYLNAVNGIISEYDNLDCLINVNFGNGSVMQAFCLITDWTPGGGAIALRSNDGEFPSFHIIYPEDYLDFIDEVKPIFDTDYPDAILKLLADPDDEEKAKEGNYYG